MTNDNSSSAGPSTEEWTVRRVLKWTTAHLDGKGCESPRLDAEVLLAHARGCERVELYIRFTEVVTDTQRAEMREMVQRRANLEPVAYLVGHREFFGLDFRVTSDVLIPRPDTETLVMEALEAARTVAQPRILEIGTGSGCVAITCAARTPTAEITAVDICDRALAVARENAGKHKVGERVRFLEGDLFTPLEADERFDIVVSNPPYIRDDEAETIQPDVGRHEPSLALFSGADGLDVIRRLVSETPDYLVGGGRLFFEIAPEQSDAVQGLLSATGRYDEIRFIKDLAGAIRVAASRVIG